MNWNIRLSPFWPYKCSKWRHLDVESTRELPCDNCLNFETRWTQWRSKHTSKVLAAAAQWLRCGIWECGLIWAWLHAVDSGPTEWLDSHIGSLTRIETTAFCWRPCWAYRRCLLQSSRLIQNLILTLQRPSNRNPTWKIQRRSDSSHCFSSSIHKPPHRLKLCPYSANHVHHILAIQLPNPPSKDHTFLNITSYHTIQTACHQMTTPRHHAGPWNSKAPRRQESRRKRRRTNRNYPSLQREEQQQRAHYRRYLLTRTQVRWKDMMIRKEKETRSWMRRN